MPEIIYKEECYKIIGLCMDVHNELGKGFMEIVYKDALEVEFRRNGVSYEREKEYNIDYKGEILPHCFYADFVVYDKIILEIKAVSKIADEFLKQSLNYLSVSKIKLALLINFGEKSLVYKRIAL
jgi:GxxExxY protein